MVKFKAPTPNYKVSAAGRLVRFAADGTCLVNKKEVIDFLDSLSEITRVEAPAPKKAVVKVEAPKEEKEAPKKEKKKKKSK